MILNFPPAFDVDFCRITYPSIIKEDDMLSEQFLTCAVNNGLITCSYMTRELLVNFLYQNFNLVKSINMLEIGPFDDPFLTGPNVKYFDILDSDELKREMIKTKRVTNKVPEKIDYVDSLGNLDIIDEQFDIIFSSHVIEHQPNFIKHLNSVNRLLKDNGLYILFIPNKEYCFDYFQQLTDVASIIEANRINQTLHSFRSIFNMHCNNTHNNPINHWKGIHGQVKCTIDNYQIAINVYNNSIENNKYVDVHEWYFTPANFFDIITKLNQLNLINLEIYRICHTVQYFNEFLVILRKRVF